MLKLMQRLTNRRDETGASAVEYGLLVAAIAAIIVIIVFALGNIIQGSFKKTCDVVAGNGDSSVGSASCDAN